MSKPNPHSRRQLLAALPAAALLLAAFAGSLLEPRTAWSDDRDLFGSQAGKPYIFFILDTGSSMRLAQGTLGLGGTEPGEGLPLDFEDPRSKLFIAKKAIYKVVEEVGNNAVFGFATFDRSGIYITDKSYRYTLQENPSWLSRPEFAGGSDTAPWLGPGTSNVAYPRAGHPLAFGDNLSALEGGTGARADSIDPYWNQRNDDDGSCLYPEDLDVDIAEPVRVNGGAATGAASKNITHQTDTRGLGQLWAFEKLDRDGQSTTIQWFKYKNQKYKLTWHPLTGGQQLGDYPLTVRVDFQRLSNGNCSSPAFENIAIGEELTLVPLFTTDLDGDPIGPELATYIPNHGNARGYLQNRSYRMWGACEDDPASTWHLEGHDADYWEGNHDDTGWHMSYDDIPDPLGRGPAFDRGDMVPFDWTNPGYEVGNAEEIMRRLAPSIVIGEAPDFRVARYFQEFDDSDAVKYIPLKPEFADYPPIFSGTGTPIAGSMAAFRVWLDEWMEQGKDHVDPECSGVHLVLITDGVEECAAAYPGSVLGAKFCEGATLACPGNDHQAPPTQADILLNAPYPGGHPLAGEPRGIKTHVVAFSMLGIFPDDWVAAVNDIAKKGGTCSDRNGDSTVDEFTECAYLANDRLELLEALKGIITEIRAEPRSFVPAATPARSYNINPQTVLSNFLPVPGESIWDGHLNAFISPLPLTADGRPNTGRQCNGTTITESCFLWDAGDELEQQAPTAAEVAADPPILDLGPGGAERRVFYGMDQSTDPDALPVPRRFLEWTASTTVAEWDDLVAGMGLTPSGGSCGDGTCTVTESPCTCPADCGSPPGSEAGLCADFIDNDCDILPDCSDPDCSADPACTLCGDGTCDGATEDSCNCAVDCGSPPATEVGLCTDGINNDCDGEIDCGDGDCSPDPACAACGDGFCDPGEDPCSCPADCGSPPASEAGLCSDSIDNDCDGALDCSDLDCSLEPACIVCGDGSCDPGEDSCNCTIDCGPFPDTEAGFCSDLVDNDCDTAVDCADSDCAADVACAPLGKTESEEASTAFSTGGATSFAEPPALLTDDDRAKAAVRETLRIKSAVVPDPESDQDVTIEYVLGDIFHSDPVTLGAPQDGRYYALDLFSTDPFDCTDNPGYRCYFEKHRYRRQVLMAGSNDGQVHAFDLGTFEYTADPETDGEYNNGTGREIFAYIPRAVLPSILEKAESAVHSWGVDNPFRVADVFIDPAHDGTPSVDDREWRTVAVGGLRRGGRLVFALDMTQPDELDSEGVGVPMNGYVPSCWDGLPTSNCGPVAYGQALWEFTDTWDEDPPGQTGNGNPDLGDSWSVTNVGTIRVLEDVAGTPTEVVKFVAIFGGGLDPAMAGNLGNWLYMVDIETGKTIYKRRLSSSAASEPAAVDISGDGHIDSIYIPTVDGYLYKADVGTPQLLDPTATVTEYSTGSPVARTVKRVTDASWDPFAIFDTGGRPIYYPPSVIFVAKLGKYSLAFGTGDRENIISITGEVGRFYNVVDDEFAAGDARLPLTEADLVQIDADEPTDQTADLLVDPPAGFEAGWVVLMTADERVAAKSLAFGGVLTWPTFNPEITETSECGGSGTGRIYIINTTNANSVATVDDVDTRYYLVEDFVSTPYVESGVAPDDTRDDAALNNPCAGLESLTQTLMGLFPPSCKFTNRTENVMSQRSDTRVECIAPVPVCVDQRNWKEF